MIFKLYTMSREQSSLLVNQESTVYWNITREIFKWPRLLRSSYIRHHDETVMFLFVIPEILLLLNYLRLWNFPLGCRLRLMWSVLWNSHWVHTIHPIFMTLDVLGGWGVPLGFFFAMGAVCYKFKIKPQGKSRKTGWEEVVVFYTKILLGSFFFFYILHSNWYSVYI